MEWSKVLEYLKTKDIEVEIPVYLEYDIDVDLFSSEVIELPGRLGMTFAPGKSDSNENRNLQKDLQRLRKVYDTDLLISLVQPYELKMLGISKLCAVGKRCGIAVIRYPIFDGKTPENVESMGFLVNHILQALYVGRNVVIHCWGGYGRTGLVSACCLVGLGYSADDAIEMVRETRSRTIETKKQEVFIKAFEGYLKEKELR